MKQTSQSLVDNISSIRRQKDEVMKNFRKKVAEVKIRQLQKELKNNEKER